jgi:hypothetical protein
MATIINKKGTSAWVRLIANGTVVITGNDSVSNIASPGETITSGAIRKVFYSSPSANAAYWSIRQDAGANVLYFDGTGLMDLAEEGCAVPITGNLVANLNGATSGFVMIEISKKGAAV